MRIFETRVVKNIKARILCSVTFSENHSLFETVWKDKVQPERQQMTKEYGTCSLHAR
jgi:hypothetical protein